MGALVVTKWIQTDQLIDVHQVQPMVPTRLVLLDQDRLPWNSEVDSVEGKQNKYHVSFTSSLRRSYYIFFFCDSKINLCKKRKRIKYSTEKKKKKKICKKKKKKKKFYKKKKKKKKKKS